MPQAPDLEAYDMACLRATLKTAEGRRVLWAIMSHCNMFGSIFETSSKIYYNAGRQDVGHFLLTQVVKADDNAFTLMSSEARQLAQSQGEQQ